MSKSRRAPERKTKKSARNRVEIESEIAAPHIQPRKISVKPITEAQKEYDKSIFANQITFGIGPAGTGKTWLASVRAAQEFAAKRIERIIITRPAVEAGENLGFMPGELEEKYEPYFRPVRDALEEYLGTGAMEYAIKAKLIEARPLAFLRGATIKNSWLIADEMQNSTPTQMKMLLTRVGENSKFIINGDPTQCDLPSNTKSGLMDAVDKLKKVGGINVVRFEEDDIVRSGIAMEIVKAYSKKKEFSARDDYNETDLENNDGIKRTLGVG